jgi:hypothetical protein
MSLLLPISWSADNTGAATTPTPAATATATDAVKVAFGIMSLSDDRHSFTMTGAKGEMLTLKITDQTALTRDLKKVALTALALTQQVRITYRDDIAQTIDQLTPEKKKKKKTV